MGNLYQLPTPDKRINGSYFFVNGPYDKHGFVLSSTKRVNKWGKIEYLNLVRGTGNKKTTGNATEPKPKEIKVQKSFHGYSFKQLVKAFADDVNLSTHDGKKWLKLYNRASWRNVTLISQTDTELLLERANGERLKIVQSL